jgi:hypothetical protein
MKAGIGEFMTDLADAVRAATLPELDRMVEELQPRFLEGARGLVIAAREHEITIDTSPTEVVEREDHAFTAAYNAMKRSWIAIQPIVEFRILMSKVFLVSPMPDELRRLALLPGMLDHDTTNWSVAFTSTGWSPTTGLLVGNTHASHLDWLALARVGLRLNTPTDVAEMLAGHDRPTLEEHLSAQASR